MIFCFLRVCSFEFDVDNAQAVHAFLGDKERMLFLTDPFVRDLMPEVWARGEYFVQVAVTHDDTMLLASV